MIDSVIAEGLNFLQRSALKINKRKLHHLKN